MKLRPRAVESKEVAARLECALPDEEDLVDRPKGVDLELVVRIVPGDEQLDVVVPVDRRVARTNSGLRQ
jgi:hypothetical protein